VRIPSSSGLIKIDLVNPTIEKFYDPIWTEEGCLSFPNLLVKTQRYNEIVIKTDVWPYRFIATGLLAICCQHEIDHFNGKKLLIDWKK
jgi:peptide deformylase